MSRKVPMTDARLDRTAAAWHDEYCRWSWQRDGNNIVILRTVKVELGEAAQITMHTLRGRKHLPDRIDADAWLNTYRDRAAARAALDAALSSQERGK